MEFVGGLHTIAGQDEKQDIEAFIKRIEKA